MAEKRTDKTISVLIRKVPAEIHAQFKSQCAIAGISMNEAMIKMLTKETKRGIRKTSARIGDSNQVSGGTSPR